MSDNFSKGVVGLCVGVLLATVVNDQKNFSLWAKDGACAKEFKVEAALRGFDNVKKDDLELSAYKKSGHCKASFKGNKGNKISISWKANQGGHVPVPLSEQLGAMGIPPPSASAPASAP